MNKSKQIIGLLFLIVLITVAIFFWFSKKETNTKPENVTASSVPSATVSAQTVSSPNQIVTISPKPTASPSQFTDEFKAKVRSDFIANCKTYFGQQYTAECNCAADYLAAHYSEAQLAKVYVEYHSSSKVPKEIQAAYDACKTQ